MNNKKRQSNLLASTAILLSAGVAAAPVSALAQSNPSVVVTVENAQPSRGTFLTPPWLALHDGTFDLYDLGAPAGTPLGGNEIEAMAEDGNNGPLTETFARLAPLSPQIGALVGPGGPLAPGDRVSVTLNVDPRTDRYFSYASMVIPSNDFFVANGNPLAHEIFDENGQFVAENFIVRGGEVNDAGTETNNEIASDVAFLAQAAPNTGPTENGVITLVPSQTQGFAAPGALSFPNGVLSHPVFGNGDFAGQNNGVFRVSFRYVDLGGTTPFSSRLSADQEVGAAVASDGRGAARVTSVGGQIAVLRIRATSLTGPIVAAHLHLGAKGVNGPVIVDLSDRIRSNGVSARISASDLTDAFEGDFADLLNDFAAGNVYINLHTAAFPAGEIRGQIELAETRASRSRAAYRR